MSDALHIKHEDAADKLYVAAGVAQVCDKVIQLPLEIKRYLDATKQRSK